MNWNFLSQRIASATATSFAKLVSVSSQTTCVSRKRSGAPLRRSKMMHGRQTRGASPALPPKGKLVGRGGEVAKLASPQGTQRQKGKMAYKHSYTSTPQGSDFPERGKYVLYCQHHDEAGEGHFDTLYGNNKQQLAKKRKHSKSWCCYCQGAEDI